MTFRSRVFKTEAERDAWARDFAEAGRRNYDYFSQRFPDSFPKTAKKITRQEAIRFGAMGKKGRSEDHLKRWRQLNKGARPVDGYLKMRKDAAFKAGIIKQFLARRALKRQGIATADQARKRAQHLFNKAMRWSNPKYHRPFDALVRQAGWA